MKYTLSLPTNLVLMKVLSQRIKLCIGYSGSNNLDDVTLSN